MIEQVVRVVSEVLGVPSTLVGAKTSARDLVEWDSLRHMNLIVAIEDRFAVTLDESRFAELDSVDAISKELERVGARAA
jgi:acyl carrier protein